MNFDIGRVGFWVLEES